MCITCKSIEEKARRAHAQGNEEMTRVMAVVLANHLKHNHPEQRDIALILPEFIIWPDGTRWIVRL